MVTGVCVSPADVDTPEPDEKSLITYVSQLYEIFPEPPSIHPLFNIVSTPAPASSPIQQHNTRTMIT